MAEPIAPTRPTAAEAGATPAPTRRAVLTGSALGGLALSTSLLSGCGLSRLPRAMLQGPSAPLQWRFTETPWPGLHEPQRMAQVNVQSALVLNRNGRERFFPLRFRPLLTTGQLVPRTGGGQVVAGGILDLRGQPVRDGSVAGPGPAPQLFSDCPDGMTLLRPMPGVTGSALGVVGHPLFAVLQFEYVSHTRDGASAYGRQPSPMAVLTLDQDPSSGEVRLVSYHPVDVSTVHGLRLTCAASLTPWNTHLGSEEYPPDAFAARDSLEAVTFRAFVNTLHADPKAGEDPKRANPYLYGHVPEVSVHPDGTGTVRKHYAMGRISREIAQVCPDQRTVLMGDDTTHAGAFLFIADRPADLSSGAMYAARWIQRDGVGPGWGELRWIRLGHATSDEIEALAHSRRPEQIVEVRHKDPQDASFRAIHFQGRKEWVRFNPAERKAAAFLETHRYAAWMGATLGFTKWEGVALNVRDRVAYVAMSSVRRSMIDGTSDIRVQGPAAGAVYAMPLAGSQRDSEGDQIHSHWVPTQMQPVRALIGTDWLNADALGNRASLEAPANPDNLKFSETWRTLFVGEDSGMHTVNALWAYQVDSGKLARIATLPAGAELSALHVADDLNGWMVVTCGFQHPGSGIEQWPAAVRERVGPLLHAAHDGLRSATVGCLLGWPNAAQR